MLPPMTIDEAYERASMILEEEQAEPTLKYSYAPTPLNSVFLSGKGMKSPVYGLQPAAWDVVLAGERKLRPRKVHEDPKRFVFTSTNFDLLVKVFSQIAESEKSTFIFHLLENYVRNPKSAVTRYTPFPSYDDKTSALALLAEFCVRMGYLKQLLEATQHPRLPTPSLVIMLMEIEEMMALNFNLFSDSELSTIGMDLAQLRHIGERQTYAEKGPRGGPKIPNPHFRKGYQLVGREIVDAIKGIVEESRKARYFYLRGALQELPNLEIESDKRKVEDFLVKLGFSDQMVKALNAAESDYKSTATAFELKNCLSHLRSFLEHLHREAAKAVAAAAGETVVDKWGDGTLYLRQKAYLTKQHEAFAASLYTLISDTSVHPLGADREYARLLRNVVIEYGVMFLTTLDKKQVKIQ